MFRRCLIALTLMLFTTIAMAQEGAATPSAPMVATMAPLPAGFPDPVGFQWKWVADGFDSPLGLITANDGTGRVFVVEQGWLPCSLPTRPSALCCRT